MAQALELAVELPDAVLGASEHDRGAVQLEHRAKRPQFGRCLHMQQAMLEVGLRGRLDADKGGVVEMALGHRGDPVRHGGRSEDGLGLESQGQDPLHVFSEAGVEHLIRLIEHQVFDAAERKQPPADHVQQPAGRGHDHVDALAKARGLGRVADASVEKGAAHRQAERGQHRVDLDRELSGRNHHQATRARGGSAQPLGERQDEGQGLAGPGGSLDHDIASGQEEWDGSGLDLDWRVKGVAGERSGGMGADAELSEALRHTLVNPLSRT